MKHKPLVLSIVAAFFLLCLEACSTTFYVGQGDPGYGHRVSRKVGRGVANVVTSPFEIPNQSIRMAQKGDSVPKQAAGYVGGLFVGAGYFVWRFGAGLVDIITAPVTFWDRAVINPEFIDFHVRPPTESEIDAKE